MVDDGSAHIIKFWRNQSVEGTLGNGKRNGEAKEGETEVESKVHKILKLWYLVNDCCPKGDEKSKNQNSKHGIVMCECCPSPFLNIIYH